jgi:hypothetical protein
LLGPPNVTSCYGKFSLQGVHSVRAAAVILAERTSAVCIRRSNIIEWPSY